MTNIQIHAPKTFKKSSFHNHNHKKTKINKSVDNIIPRDPQNKKFQDLLKFIWKLKNGN